MQHGIEFLMDDDTVALCLLDVRIFLGINHPEPPQEGRRIMARDVNALLCM